MPPDSLNLKTKQKFLSKDSILFYVIIKYVFGVYSPEHIAVYLKINRLILSLVKLRHTAPETVRGFSFYSIP